MSPQLLSQKKFRDVTRPQMGAKTVLEKAYQDRLIGRLSRETSKARREQG
jgi:hypothetical protein